MLWGNVINALVGVWFIIAPFVLGLQANPGATWTSIIGGLILLVLAGWAVLNEEARKRRWIQYVNGSVGVWFCIYPLFFSSSSLTAVALAGGVTALSVSAWLLFGGSLFGSSEDQQSVPPPAAAGVRSSGCVSSAMRGVLPEPVSRREQDVRPASGGATSPDVTLASKDAPLAAQSRLCGRTSRPWVEGRPSPRARARTGSRSGTQCRRR